MFKNMYWAWDGVLEDKFCDYVLGRLNWDAAETGKVREGVGIVNEEARITQVLWEELNTPIAAVASHYTHMANELAEWDFDIKYPQRVQLGRYCDGGHYDWHMDIAVPDERKYQRKLSCSIILNSPSEYEGGLLEFEGVDTPPPNTRGSVIIFPSMVKHRVTPVTSGTRYSAVCWTVGPAFK